MDFESFPEDPLAIDVQHNVHVKEEPDQEFVCNLRPSISTEEEGQNYGSVGEGKDDFPIRKDNRIPTTTDVTENTKKSAKRPRKPETRRIRRKQTDEEYKRKIERDKLGHQRRMTAMTSEEKEAYYAKRREDAKRIRMKRTPEQKEIYKTKVRFSNQQERAKKLKIELDDEDYPITVSTNATGGKRSTVEINLRNYCIFCLRKTTNHREALSVVHNENLIELLQVVPKAEYLCSASELLSIFNQIWESLNQQQPGNEDAHWILSLLKLFTNNSGTSFSDIPRMCQFCAEKLETVYKHLKEALTVMDTLRKTIRESKFGGSLAWRAVDFERALKASRMEKESIHQTISFLDDLGRNTIKNNNSMDPRSSNNTQPAKTFRILETTSLSDGPSLSTRFALPVNQKLKQFAFRNPASVRIQVEGIAEGMEFQEEVDQDSGPGDDDDDDPDYIKSEEEDSSSSDGEVDDTPIPQNIIRNNAASSSHQYEISGDSSCRSGAGASYIANASIILPSQPFMGTGVRGNPHMPLDPKENITFATTVDPITGKDTYTCLIDGCGQSFSAKHKKLRPHQRSKHKNFDDPSMMCDICGKKYRDAKYVKKHKKAVHPNNNEKTLPSHKCDLCKLEVLDSKSLDHAKTHLGPIGEEYLIKCPNPDCPYVFFKFFSLKYHLKSLSCKNFSEDSDRVSKITKVCEICNFSGKNTMDLRAHINNIHESVTKNYPCPIDGCEQRFTHKQSVILHLPQHDIRQGFERQVCKCRKNVQLEEMENHLREDHQAQEIIKCSQCPFLFSTRVDLLDHLFKHRYSGLFCDICNDNVKYSRHAQLLEHYFQVHKIGSKVVCEQCDKVFWKKSKLSEHCRTFHEGKGTTKKKIFDCDQCDIVFKSVSSVRAHKIREHGAHPYCCSFCSETFTSLAAFNKHEKEHKGVKVVKEVFTCEVEGCRKVYTSKLKLKQHHSSTHLGEKPNVCELCGKSYALYSSLKHHINTVHLGRRPKSRVCEICNESFWDGQSLRRHKLIHSGERPFACEMCGQTFRQKEVLKRHVESHERKGADFKPSGPMKQIRKRVERK